MLTIDKVLAGVQRSLLLTSEGVFAWGNLEVVRTLPEGVEAGEVCTTDATQIGHRRFAQPVPQRLSSPGTRWEGVADAGHLLLAWAEGQAYAFAPQVRGEAGVQLRRMAFAGGEVRRIWAAEQQVYFQDGAGALWTGAEAGTAPQRVAGLPAVKSLSLGMAHALALDGAGQVWAWGTNAAGQLGQGDLAEHGAARRVPLPHAAVAVAAGATHSLALDERGRLWGWGSNHHGQLAFALGAAFSPRPRRLALPGPVRHLAAGLHFSAALTPGGQVLAWGWNGLGQLGQGDALARPGVHAVPGLEAVRQISVGGSHVLALARDGRCWAWGDNRHANCQGDAGAATQARPQALALHALRAAPNQETV